MVNPVFVEWALLALVALTAAVAAVYWLTPGRSPDQAALLRSAPSENPVFLFDGDNLVSTTPSARQMVGRSERGFDWTGLRDKLLHSFPGFPESPARVREVGQMDIPSIQGPAAGSVLCEWINGVVRVELRAGNAGPLRIDSKSSAELEILRLAMDAAPYPAWRSDSAGTVTWHNRAYLKLHRLIRGRQSDPALPLFPNPPDRRPAGSKKRVSISPDGRDQKLWFDLSVVRQDSGSLHYAIDINAVVDAEIAQRNFVQTLAKTFAQLSIGLAIFDRNRQLALFNPALVDLTSLPADFLSARPTLLTFLDRMRDRNMMPEPKNYGSWRDQMADLVEAASSGSYQETWTLPSGSVYSVSGRPHPDGAVAFLFEDITAEITLTRRFRSELELGQSILDELDMSIAVFASDGTLAFSNAAYDRLWEVSPNQCFAQMAILDATRTWQAQCTATPIWGDIRDFVSTRDNRSEWWAPVELKSGQPLICSVHPIPTGATMVTFNAPSQDRQTDMPVEKSPEPATL